MRDSPQQALAESVRRLVDATIRTEVDPSTVAAVTARIDAATEQLRTALMSGSFGQRHCDDGQPMVRFKPVHFGKTRCAPLGDAMVMAEGEIATPAGSIRCSTN